MNALSRYLTFLRQHRRLATLVLIWTLVAVALLQNMEPTRIRLWFWTLIEVPKLFLILGSMIVGVALWELIRWTVRRYSGEKRRSRDRRGRLA